MVLNSYKQHTLKRAILAKGIGLHGGNKVEIRLLPAFENTGIVFRRIDLGNPMDIPAEFENVTSTMLNTGVSKDGITVNTIEHLMATFSGMGIDNCIVEMNGSEVPVMDGSSKQFVTLIESAGIVEQQAPIKILRINKTVTIRDGDKFASISPYAGFRVDFAIDFPSKIIGKEELGLDIDRMAFKKIISSARTFGMISEIDALQAMGLCRGGSLENAIVVQGDRILNEEGLRFKNEFVRHKILDAMGDLFLAGGRIMGAVKAYKSGHALNNKLLRKLFADETAFSWVEMTSHDLPVISEYESHVA